MSLFLWIRSSCRAQLCFLRQISGAAIKVLAGAAVLSQGSAGEGSASIHTLIAGIIKCLGAY